MLYFKNRKIFSAKLIKLLLQAKHSLNNCCDEIVLFHFKDLYLVFQNDFKNYW